MNTARFARRRRERRASKKSIWASAIPVPRKSIANGCYITDKTCCIRGKKYDSAADTRGSGRKKTEAMAKIADK